MKCGKITEIFSRVVGYMRPVEMWNKGKKEEFKDRLVYDQKKLSGKRIINGTLYCKECNWIGYNHQLINNRCPKCEKSIETYNERKQRNGMVGRQEKSGFVLHG